ncbi:hypothetical protein GIB67_002203 [Kingdonia uniflora]|uniref:Uncharacterized protein n=1 Tax=Kingdonia uniflora TaxID=39325 RepID=A0A7J7KWW3_9MAGN|nr:hypothetical protein GIB67_002203 [Kingdonia uniflora]
MKSNKPYSSSLFKCDFNVYINNCIDIFLRPKVEDSSQPPIILNLKVEDSSQPPIILDPKVEDSSQPPIILDPKVEDSSQQPVTPDPDVEASPSLTKRPRREARKPFAVGYADIFRPRESVFSIFSVLTLDFSVLFYSHSLTSETMTSNLQDEGYNLFFFFFSAKKTLQDYVAAYGSRLAGHWFSMTDCWSTSWTLQHLLRLTRAPFDYLRCSLGIIVWMVTMNIVRPREKLPTSRKPPMEEIVVDDCLQFGTIFSVNSSTISVCSSAEAEPTNVYNEVCDYNEGDFMMDDIELLPNIEVSDGFHDIEASDGFHDSESLNDISQVNIDIG